MTGIAYQPVSGPLLKQTSSTLRPSASIRTALCFAFVATLGTACDSAAPEDIVVAKTEDPPLSEQIVGLWQRDTGPAVIDWLFKTGGIYHAGQPRPFYPVVGRWEIRGDTLHIEDDSCFDARGRYLIEMDDDAFTAAPIFDDCELREGIIVGDWDRFVYGE